MSKKKEKPIVLDAEEQAIEDALMANFDKLEDVGGIERYVKMAQEQVQRKEARMNLRVAKSDVNLLRRIAEKKGIGYQTLATSVLHQFATGQLVESSSEIERLTKAITEAMKSLQPERTEEKKRRA